jgi:hypothetical protein
MGMTSAPPSAFIDRFPIAPPIVSPLGLGYPRGFPANHCPEVLEQSLFRIACVLVDELFEAGLGIDAEPLRFQKMLDDPQRAVVGLGGGVEDRNWAIGF